MKKCKSCQTDISEKANKCPNCKADQRNFFLKHKILSIIAVLIVLGVIGSLGSGAKKVGSNDNSQTNKTAAQPQSYKVGDKVQLGTIILTVNSVENSQGGQYTKPQAGNQYVNLNVTMENTGKDQEYITTMGQMFVLDSNKNQSQVAITDRSIENPGVVTLDGALLAGSKKSGWVGFEVPTTATGLKFQYNASFYNDKSITVNLK